MFDLVIKDAEIFDGSGATPQRGDLGVTGGKIVEIGKALGAAKETVKADGLALSPGIIDGHTHYDAQITWDPFVDPSPTLGVTTAVLGNCGFTIAPCKPADRDITMRHLTHVEGMSLDALRAGINWGFESFPQYLDMLEKQGVGPNVACFSGHSSVRTWVMGAEATERAATDDEIARMAALVREAMAAGAVGFASSTAEAHNGEGGTPMPSRLADDKELRALVKAMAESGQGVYMLTKGSKTSIPYLEEIAVEAKRPVVIAALFHNSTNPSAAFTWLQQVNEARRRGHQLVAQTSCCRSAWISPSRAPYLFESMQAWKPAMAAHGDAELTKIYSDPAWRAKVRQELEERRGRLLFNGEWNKLFVVETARTPIAARRCHARRCCEKAGQGPARLHPRPGAVGKSRHAVRGPAPPQRRYGSRQDPGRPRHPHLAVGCGRASHFLLRRGLRPASARPLEPRSRRARPAAGRASPHRPAGKIVRHPESRVAEAGLTPPT